MPHPSTPNLSTPNLSTPNLPDRPRIAADLTALIDGEVRFSEHDRLLYATDASIYQVEPIGVVVPRGGRDLEAVVAYCREHGLPLLPRGGGTSLAGQAVNHAVVVDFSRYCNRLVELDTRRRLAVVEPGIVLDELNAQLRPHGLGFGPDVATSTHANIGGMIGNNSAGARSIVYGRTVEHLEALAVLLSDGRRLRLERGAAGRDADVGALTRQVAAIVEPMADEIERVYPRTRRRVDGYNLDLVLEQLRASTPGTHDAVNLAHLVCGSEGTLCMSIEATLRLIELPRVRGLAVVAFADVDAALAALADILPTAPSAVELVDDVIMRIARDNLEYRRYLDLLPSPERRLPGAVLYVEYSGDDDPEIDAAVEALRSAYGDAAVRRLADPAQVEQVWKLRKAGEPLLYGAPGRRKPLTFIEDLAVDPVHLPEFIRRFRDIVRRHGTTAAYYAHASVGCLHIRPRIDPRDRSDLAAMQAIAEEATDLVMSFGGALSGEHGDGRLRSHLLERFYGTAVCDAFRRVKAVFDPRGRMNPGIIVDPPGMTEHLRVSPGGRTLALPTVETFYRYEREEGFGAALEICNGAGVCRRRSGGTMCPSYRATLDERHATRGRANALRLAITGQLTGSGSSSRSSSSSSGGGPAWDDAETLLTLDLCLGCKACKSECPSNVDVAKLKVEYLAQHYRREEAPAASRLFGRIGTLSRAGAAAPGLVNGLAGSGPARWLAERLLGIDRRRSLPRFARSLHRRAAARTPLPVPDDAPAVVLMPDCFTAYGEPHIGLAAIDVLEGMGYRVILPRIGCCGRAAISLGMLPLARRQVTATGRRLAALRAAHRPVAILGCEPSCVSALTDDWLDLETDLDAAEIAAIAAETSTIEDFLETAGPTHPVPLALTPVEGLPVLLHGHCHHKALVGLDAVTRLLRRIAGDRLEVLDAGCCGMAGAFGYTRDHYDLSLRIAELALLPAVREQPEAAVVASGTSCRHQLRDALGVEAVHPIEMVRAAI